MDITRVYVDGVYDLFHRGHVESLQKAKSIRPNVFLIVGLISDNSATDYKREPIFADDDRYALLKACRYVDQVIYNAPLIVTRDFLDQYKIDLVVHGFSDMKDLKKQQPFFEQIQDKFELIPYFPYNSTTRYIEKLNKKILIKEASIIPNEGGRKIPQNINHYHGGQDIHSMKCPVKVDMSVTTNGLGPIEWHPETLLSQIDHYPPIVDNELYHEYCQFMKVTDCPVIFGNGASEVIDLALRNIDPSYNTWKTNQVDVQYAEYENSCSATGRRKVSFVEDASIHVIVNPNNPTGDFLNWEQMEQYVATNIKNNSILIVDESMLFWYGSEWRQQSFTSHETYINNLQNTRNIKVIIVQSWTKIFACTGLRFGSILIYDKELYNTIRTVQTPWSVNVFARDYILKCWKNTDYLLKTWDTNPRWRKEIISRLQEYYPDWTFYGNDFCSYIWIDTHKEIVAERLTNISKDNGFPIRHGKYSYERPTYIRLGVRNPERLEEWFQLIRNLQPGTIVDNRNIPSDIVIEQTSIEISKIATHENVIMENVTAFESYLEKSQNFLIPSIIVSEEGVLIDGHHRLELMKKMGYKLIPVTIINYNHPAIFTHIEENKRLPKHVVIETALRQEKLLPKSTRHVLNINNKFVPLSILSVNVSLEF